MMIANRMKTLLWILAAGLVVAGVVTFVVLRSETMKIRAQFVAIADTVSKSAGEGNIMMAVKMQRLGLLLADEVEVRLREYPFEPRVSSTELVSLTTRGRAYFERLDISIIDVETEIISEGHARSRCAAKVKGKSTYQAYDEIRNFTAELSKIDGKWRFTAFREDEMLKR